MNWSVFKPNAVLSKRSMKILIVGQGAAFMVAWAWLTPAVIPKPMEVLSAFGRLWAGGIVGDLFTSVGLYVEAVAWATIISLGLAYVSAVGFFLPAAQAWSKLRFLGLVGLSFLFTLYIHGVHDLKLALLVFSISVFLLPGMMDVLDSIPREKYDLARTLRMGEWEVVWEVIILGRLDVAIDIIRQNAAIGWMMLGMVEGLFRSEGGIGTLLMTQYKHFHLAEVAAIQITILGVGVFQDYAFGWVKAVCFPYASLLLERR